MFKVKKIHKLVNWRTNRNPWGLRISVALLAVGLVGAMGVGFSYVHGTANQGDNGDGEGSPVNPPSNPPAGPPGVTTWSIEAAYETTEADPEAPGGLFAENFLSKVESDDKTYFTTAYSEIDKGWDGQVYKFKISAPAGGLGYSGITLHWTGYGEPTAGYLLHAEMYNQLEHTWDLAAAPAQTHALEENVSINLDLVDSFSAYVASDGTLWVRIRADNVQLEAPDSLEGNAASSNEVRLSWHDYSSGETGYKLERQKQGDSTWQVVANLPPDTTTYTDYDSSRSALLAGSTYLYHVSAVAGEVVSDPAESSYITLPAKGSRHGATINVPADASTIQEAVNIAQQSDTIKIAAGTYAEAVVVRTPKLTLSGSGVNQTSIDVPTTCKEEFCSAVAIDASSIEAVTVEDMTLQHGGGSLLNGRRFGGGVLVKGSAATLRRLAIMRNQLLGASSDGAAVALVDSQASTIDNVAAMLNISSGAVFYASNADKGTVLRHVTASGNGSEQHDPAAGFWAEGSSGSLDIVNSIFWSNAGSLAEVASDGGSKAVSVDHSIAGPTATVSGIGGSVAQAASIKNSTSNDPKLTANDNPHLGATSPAIDAADSGSSTAYDYENSSRPSGSSYDIGAAEYQSAKSGGGKSKTELILPQRVVQHPEKPRRPHASLNTDYIALEISDVTPPAAPTGLRFTSVGTDRVVLTWTDNAQNEDGFIVHRLDASGEVALAPIASHGGTGTVVFPDYGADLPTGRLFPGTEYCYYVEAYRGSAAAASEFTDPCPVTEGTLGNVPQAPDHVAVAGISAGQIRVNWNDNSNDEEGFVLYRRKQGTSDDFTIVNPPAVANATSYIDWGGDTPEGVLESGATYCYQVAAYNVNGLSARAPGSGSAACGATLLQTWVEVFEGSGQANKSPTPSDPGERSDIRFGGENDSVELDTDLSRLFDDDNAYNWQVFAIHLDTPPAGLTTLNVRWRGRGEDQPGHPVRFSFYDFATNSWVHQRVFNDGHDDEGDIRGSDPIRGSANALYSFNFTSQQLASSYSHRVGSYDNTVLMWVRGRAFIAAPDAPGDLQANPEPLPTTVYLKWEDLSNNETGFEIERATPVPPGPLPVEESWSLVGRAAANETSYSESVPVASLFRYRVRAMRNSMGSSYAGPIDVSTPLYGPYLPYVVPAGSSSIRVNWQLNPSNGSRFAPAEYAAEVYRALGTNPVPSDWEMVGRADRSSLTYLDQGLEPNTTYSYKLRFLVQHAGADWNSVYSETVYTKTTPVAAPAAPENLKAEPVSISQINLLWDDVANETSYVLERQNGLTGTWQTVSAAIGANVTSFGDVGLGAGQLYRYRVRAANSSGYSGYSNVASATTLPATGEEWAVLSTLPTKGSLDQGIAVLASHSGYLYAASNDAAGQGAEEWQHLNVWRSLDAGKNDPWHWVGQTATGVANNVPAAMTSFNGKLFLLTGSSVWVSSNNGSSWVEAWSQGVGDALSQGFFSHMTVYGGRLYVLLSDGSLFSTADGSGWLSHDAAPAGLAGLGQFNGSLLGYTDVSPLVDVGPTTAHVYKTNNASSWTSMGTVPGDDSFGRCDDFNGLLGLGTYIFSGAQNSFTHEPCLRVSNSNGVSWSRTGGYLNIWAALPGATTYIASTASTPDVVAGRIETATGLVVAVPVSGLGSSYRMWSLASHGGKRYAAAYQVQSLNPVNPPPTAILELH